jgi:predicted amidophosphoribosyltransferase
VILDLLAPPLCWSCKAPAARASALCGECRGRLRFLPRVPVALGSAALGIEVWAPVAYDGPARDLVRALKFHGATRLAEQMAALIVANAPPALLGEAAAGEGGEGAPPGLLGGDGAAAGAGPAVLVPVPLHPARRRVRPFNQGELIARAVAARVGLPVRDCLARCGDARRQVGRGRADRLRGPAGAVRVVESVPPAAVLVDDVATTGGTLAACAHALRSAGTQHVIAIAFARTAGR